MGVRKNAKFLSATEIEDFVRACVMMKADIVNSSAPAAQQYGRWDEYVALHRMIQNAFAPGSDDVNFGHGGTGAYSFFSWHRYFIFRFEKELQSHVPGVMLPYWDWTDPAPLMTDTFLGPNGDAGTQIVSRGYFAENAPGTGGNPTPTPAWWPAGLAGWRLHTAFPASWEGGLRRNVGGALPTLTDLQEALGMSTYATFQNAVESGSGLTSSHRMHNGLHGYIGGHMRNATASPFDPIFYLHHCNIDRLWAMWQMDGHADTYPMAGGNAEHHRNDIMYPWIGGGTGAEGYGTNVSMAPIVMPDLSALGAQRNVDTLDHRALGYTYDTLPVVGVSLDRTGSMGQLTPDPMTVAAPDVTKWVAATRGVSAFFQDCEAAYTNKEAYVYAGVETFRTIGVSHQFTPVFGATPSGLVKSGGAHSRAVFDAAVATMSPGGGTPLADALTNSDTTLVKAPFADQPSEERRYLAILTDGNRTTGSTIASIPAGSLGDTAVFAMGFGTGADVDYATLDQLVTKGTVLPTAQVFHGENAGTIDKFFTNSLCEAIGYTPIVDPVLELFAGEHTHVDFYATSAEDSFFITAQGMDFSDPNWSFHLVAPDGTMIYGHRGHDSGCGEHTMPTVNAIRSNGRLSLFMQRAGAPDHTWVGRWQLMVAYKARDMSAMLMLPVGALLAPVSAGPVRGPRYFRPLSRAGRRSAARLVAGVNAHGFDLMPPFTSGKREDACNALVNIYARTRLRMGLSATFKKDLKFRIEPDLLAGMISKVSAHGRLFSPKVDIRRLLAEEFGARITRGASLRGSKGLKFDSSKILAKLEADDPERFRLDDRMLTFKLERNGAGEARVESPSIPGVYHVGVMIQGVYHPEHNGTLVDHRHAHGMAVHRFQPERFERVLSCAIAVE